MQSGSTQQRPCAETPAPGTIPRFAHPRAFTLLVGGQDTDAEGREGIPRNRREHRPLTPAPTSHRAWPHRSCGWAGRAVCAPPGHQGSLPQAHRQRPEPCQACGEFFHPLSPIAHPSARSLLAPGHGRNRADGALPPSTITVCCLCQLGARSPRRHVCSAMAPRSLATGVGASAYAPCRPCDMETALPGSEGSLPQRQTSDLSTATLRRRHPGPVNRTDEVITDAY